MEIHYKLSAKLRVIARSTRCFLRGQHPREPAWKIRWFTSDINTLIFDRRGSFVRAALFWYVHRLSIHEPP